MLDVLVHRDWVEINGVRVPRPPNLAVTRWMDYWTDIRVKMPRA